MSLAEVKGMVYSRFKQRQKDIYSLSLMIRVAVLSCFSEENSFPDPPLFDDEVNNTESWRNSYNYMTALSKIHKGGAIDEYNNR